MHISRARMTCEKTPSKKVEKIIVVLLMHIQASQRPSRLTVETSSGVKLYGLMLELWHQESLLCNPMLLGTIFFVKF